MHRSIWNLKTYEMFIIIDIININILGLGLSRNLR